jgi:glycosyltransferase involved in cell wall biosynthesis
MRLAWFSPWPPQPSGIAGRSAEVVPALAARAHAIDVFVDDAAVPVPARQPDTPPAPGEARVSSAHDFVWRHARDPYDLVIYQIGNSRLHEFIWPYLFRWPGLVVLHDARLHHARGRALLMRQKKQAYRDEFYFDHPDAADGAAELGVRGYAGVFYYQWPMVRAVIEASRLTASHSRGAQAELAASGSTRPIQYIALGSGRLAPTPPARVAAVRASWGTGPEHVVFGVFGGLTADKRIDAILRSFAAARTALPNARLVLAGALGTDVALDDTIAALGLGDFTKRLGTLDDEEFDDSIAAVDVSLNMRWPTALEMSGPWLQAIAAGRPTVIVDHAHLADIPTLDPRTWHRHAPGVQSMDADMETVGVAIDILDEEHSLRLAIEMLGRNATLRARLGAAARRYWEREHTVERMTDDYQRAIARAAAMSAPEVALPAHLRPDPLALTRETVAPFGDAARAAIEELGQ